MIISCDTETSGLHPDPPEEARVTVVSAAWRRGGELESRAWAFGQGDWSESEETWNRVLDTLARSRLVMHNAKFDLAMLRAGAEGDEGTGYLAGRDLESSLVWDTMVAERILEPLQPVGLDESAKRMGAEGPSKEEMAEPVRTWLKKNKYRVSEIWRAPWDLVKAYATRDAELTLLLYEFQQLRLEHEDSDLQGIVGREMDLCRVLYRMEERGVAFDTARSREMGKLIRQEIRTIEESLPWQPPSLAGARQWFFGTENGGCGLIPRKVTAVRLEPQLDEEVNRWLVEEGAEGAEAWSRLQNLRSALAKWYGAWPELVGRDGRLRTSFKQTSVVTGRLAVQRVQLQAIPHEGQLPLGVESVRSLLVAGPGKVLWDLDLKNAEVRVAAAIAGCREMIEVLKSGRDVHSETATRVWGVTEADQDFGDKRNIAKRLNFGIIYGAGARTIAQQIQFHTGLQVTEEQAREWVNSYRMTFPEFYRTARRMEQQALTWKCIQLAGGRRRWFDPRMHEERKAFNAVIQGGVAEAMKVWMIGVEQRWPGILLLQIHDSLVLECEEGDEETPSGVGRLGVRLFEKLFPGVPFGVDVNPWLEKVAHERRG